MVRVIPFGGSNAFRYLDYNDREVDGIEFSSAKEKESVNSDDTYHYPLPAKIKRVKSKGKSVRILKK